MQMLRAYSGIVFHAQYSPDVIAITDDFGVHTYKELVSDSLKAVSAFREYGLSSVDRIAVVSDNRYEAVVLLLSALLGGPVVVPINCKMAIDDISWVVSHSQSKFLVSDQEFLNSLCDFDDTISHKIKCEAFGNDSGKQLGFLNWLSRFPEAHIESIYVPNRPYLQVYTSGTSGRPKGVVLTEGNCLGQLSSLLLCLDISLNKGDSIYEGLPLFHVGGVMVSLLALNRGLSVRYLRSFNPNIVLDLICAQDVEHVALVPAMIQACQNANYPSTSLRQLKTIMYGASPISETLLRSARERYDCDFFQIYGMTETHSVIAVLGALDHRRIFLNEVAAGSAGKPVPGSTLQIIDAQGVIAGNGCSGEIRVSSSHVMEGYWNDIGVTNDTIKDGFLYTGDVAYINDEGFLYIIDRIKDLIITGGENVSSLEVENVLISHPSIKDVAVIGLPDERWGESVVAVAVRADLSLTEEEIINYGKSKLAGFKSPKKVIFVETITRNANGKILKKLLRDEWSKGPTI